MALSDSQIELVKAAQAGDVVSFEMLYELYYEKIFGFARMLLRNESDAQDVLQETFITAWRKLATLENPVTFSTWLQVIAKNLCYMQMRRKNVEILLDADKDMADFAIDESNDGLPSVYVEREDLRKELSEIIDSLSDVQRQTIILYYFNELSVDEIAEVMQCSPGTVKSRLFLSRNAIKAEIQERERKSGVKFYGVAGLVILPFIKVIKAYMEPLLAGTEAAATGALSTIKEVIKTTVVEPEVPTTKPLKNQGKETMEMSKLSLSSKILIALGSLAAVGAIVTVTVIITTGIIKKPTPVDPNPNPNPEGDVVDNPGEVVSVDYLEENWNDIQGYWVVNKQKDYYVRFYNDKAGDKCMEWAIFQTDYGRGGKVVEKTINADGTITVIIQVPKYTGGINDPYPAYKETFNLDFSEYATNKIIKIKHTDVNLDANVWLPFKYGGNSASAAQKAR